MSIRPMGPSQAGLAGAFAPVDPTNWTQGKSTFLTTSTTHEPTIYVSATGDDSNDGLTWTKAKATPAAAIAWLATNSTNNMGRVKCGVGVFPLTSTLVVGQGMWLEGSGSLGSGTQGTTFEWQGADDGSWAISTTNTALTGTDFSNGRVSGFNLRPAASKPGGGAYTNVNAIKGLNWQNRAGAERITVRDFPGDGIWLTAGNSVTPLSGYPGYARLLDVWVTGCKRNWVVDGGFTHLLFINCASDFAAQTTDCFVVNNSASGFASSGRHANFEFEGFKIEAANGSADPDVNYFTFNDDVSVSMTAVSAHKATPGTKPLINYTATPGAANDVAATIPVKLTNCTTANLASVVRGPDGADWLVPTQPAGGEPNRITSWDGTRRDRDGAPNPDLHGLVAWSMAGTETANATAITVGVVRAVKLMLPRHAVLGTVQLPVLTGAVCTNAWVGILDSTGVLIGKSADQATPFATSGDKAVSITAESGKSLAKRAGDIVYVVLLIGGGTSPSFACPAGAGSPTSLNLGLTAATGYRCWTSGSSLTAIPTSFTLSSTTVSGGIYLAGVK